MFLPQSNEDISAADTKLVVADDDVRHDYVDIPPKGGTLVVFWADKAIHSVRASHAPSEDLYRWALTVWLHTTDVRHISFDAEAEARHFPDLGAAQRGLLEG